jgi:hypothetical protein
VLVLSTPRVPRMVLVRSYPGDGIRITRADAVTNDRVVDVLTQIDLDPGPALTAAPTPQTHGPPQVFSSDDPGKGSDVEKTWGRVRPGVRRFRPRPGCRH